MCQEGSRKVPGRFQEGSRKRSRARLEQARLAEHIPGAAVADDDGRRLVFELELDLDAALEDLVQGVGLDALA